MFFLNLNLEGKVVAVTGSVRGIGKEIAIGFAKEKANLIICDLDAAQVDAAKAELETYGVKVFGGVLDVSDKNAAEEFTKKAAAAFDGRIDVWINNAGIGSSVSLLDCPEALWDKVFAVNTKSIYICTNAVVPYMKEQGGVIINACSFTTLLPTAGSAVYSATKAANLSLCRTYAAELAPYHIRVVGYIPGVILTDILKSGKSGAYANKEALLRSIAMNRFGSPEDMVGPILFVASDQAAYMTGCAIEVSGGKFCVQNPDYMWNILAREL